MGETGKPVESESPRRLQLCTAFMVRTARGRGVKAPDEWWRD